MMVIGCCSNSSNSQDDDNQGGGLFHNLTTLSTRVHGNVIFPEEEKHRLNI